MRALNVFPSSTQAGNKTHHLSGLLNHCKTAQGQRTLMQWLKQPLLDLGRIKERHDMVEMLCEDGEFKTSLVRIRPCVHVPLSEDLYSSLYLYLSIFISLQCLSITPSFPFFGFASS